MFVDKIILEKLKENCDVFIFEDENISAELVSLILKKNGFCNINNFKTATAFLQILESPRGKKIISSPSIFIIDWRLPDIDGLELCKIIKKQNFKFYPYVLFISGVKDKDKISQCLEECADDYIPKPINDKELIARVKVGLRIIALEIKLKKALAKIRRIAIIDPLTGLYNRRQALKFLKRELKRAIKEDRVFNLFLFDIDHFKKINDTYGHKSGDTVLKEMGHLIRTTFREYDVAIRYGGEEFLICFLTTTFNYSVRVIERFLINLRKKEFELSEKKIKITVSGGVVGAKNSCKNIKNDTDCTRYLESAIKRADELLYKGKSEGRNKIFAEFDGNFMGEITL